MNRMSRAPMALLWIVFFLQWSFLSVHASDPAPGGRLDLAGARRLALAHSPLLQAESAALDAAAAEIQASRSAFLPTLDATGTFSRSDNPVGVFSSKLWQESFTEQDFGIDRLNRPQPRSNWQTRLILRQPIFNQGSEIIDYRLAQVGGRRAELAAEGCRQAVLYQVEADYHAVLLSGEVCGVLQAALGLARRNLDLAETRHAEGLALKSDVLAARVQATDREQELIRAENDRLLALAALNRTMGLDQDTPWEPAGDDGVETEIQALEEWTDLAASRRPEARLAQAATEAARLEARKAAFRHLPTLNLEGVYEFNSEDPWNDPGESWTVMAITSINLFRGLGDQAACAGAEARHRQARAMEQDTADRIALEVRTAYYDLKAARDQRAVAAEAVEQASEAYRILSRRYESGLALMVELLAGELALRDAKLRRIRAEFDARVAAARLRWTAGVLEDDGES